MAKLQKGVNDLETWCSNHGSFGEQLMAEWTGICDDGKHYKIEEVSFGSSHKKFKWRCSKGHEWFALIRNRTYRKTGCPYCCNANRSKIDAKAMLSEKNSLKTWCLNSGPWGQQLLNEWTGECEDSKHYEIDEVSYGSNKKFKWKCSEGHEWFADMHHRTLYKTGCPHCLRARLQKGVNDLETWCMSNGLFGQQLIKEWTGECEDGTQYNIDGITSASAKKFKWRCSEGHDWYAMTYNRTRGKTGCPYCSNIGTSYPEQFIYCAFKQIFPNTENRCKVLKSIQNPYGIEFDIGVPEIPLCIEYSPTYWHEGREEHDQYKKDLCEQYGVRFIQIVEDSYDELEHITSDNYICFKMVQYHQDDILPKIVDYILKSLGHSISEIDLELVKKNAMDYSKGKIEYEKSLTSIYPNLVEE